MFEPPSAESKILGHNFLKPQSTQNIPLIPLPLTITKEMLY